MDLKDKKLVLIGMDDHNGAYVSYRFCSDYLLRENIRNNLVLRDDVGNPYLLHLFSYDGVSDGAHVYDFEFDEEMPRLPIGLELHVDIPEWYREIPRSEISWITYSCVSSELKLENGELKIEPWRKRKTTIDCDGNVNIVQSIEERQYAAKISKKRTQKLFDEMLSCVSTVECYYWISDDDTERTVLFHFENGEELEYTGMRYRNTSVNTYDLMTELYGEIGFSKS